jgi:hypothetical protein
MHQVAESKGKRILTEFVHHLPYSIFGVMGALLVMGVLSFIVQIANAGDIAIHASGDLFHVFHAMHVLISAVATTAMFWKHDNQNVIKAITIGLVGSLTLCGLSDAIVPYFGGLILGTEMHFHICLIEEPHIVYPFAIVGVLAGLAVTTAFEKSTEYSHSIHVFISSAASLLYLMSFGLFDWMHAVTGVFFVILIAVMFPCCLSDIVLPMTCTHKFCKHDPEDVGHHH